MKVLQVSDEFRSVCSACEIQEGGSPFHLSSCPHLLLQKGGVPRWSENPKSSPMPSLSQATEVACLRSPANQSQYWDQNPASKLLFSILCVSSPRVCVSVCVCMCMHQYSNHNVLYCTIYSKFCIVEICILGPKVTWGESSRVLPCVLGLGLVLLPLHNMLIPSFHSFVHLQ